MMVGEILWVVDHKQPTPSTNNAVCSLNTDNVGFQPPLKGGGDRLAQRGWVGWSYTQTCIGGDQKGDSNLIRGWKWEWHDISGI